MIALNHQGQECRVDILAKSRRSTSDRSGSQADGPSDVARVPGASQSGSLHSSAWGDRTTWLPHASWRRRVLATSSRARGSGPVSSRGRATTGVWLQVPAEERWGRIVPRDNEFGWGHL